MRISPAPVRDTDTGTWADVPSTPSRSGGTSRGNIGANLLRSVAGRCPRVPAGRDRFLPHTLNKAVPASSCGSSIAPSPFGSEHGRPRPAAGSRAPGRFLRHLPELPSPGGRAGLRAWLAGSAPRRGQWPVQTRPDGPEPPAPRAGTAGRGAPSAPHAAGDRFGRNPLCAGRDMIRHTSAVIPVCMSCNAQDAAGAGERVTRPVRPPQREIRAGHRPSHVPPRSRRPRGDGRSRPPDFACFPARLSASSHRPHHSRLDRHEPRPRAGPHKAQRIP